MPRVVPSQVVDLLVKTFPNPVSTPTHPDGIGQEYAPVLQAIASLAREIPSELLTLSGDDYADYAAAIGAIEFSIKHWLARGNVQTLAMPKRRGVNAIALLHQALTKCPDDAPTASTAQLSFISDTDLRDSIRRDISAAERDLINGEWKGATVLAAAGAEALLLWALQAKTTDRQKQPRSPPSDVPGAATTAVNAKVLSRAPSTNLEEWTLHEYNEVAQQLNLISDGTAMQVRLAKDFRNLIHPGRAKRLAIQCDRGTAFSALAAVELVVRDLST